MKFEIGDIVKKKSGYDFLGEVRCVFTTLQGKERIVVEMLNSVGLLHIFSEDNVELAGEAALEIHLRGEIERLREIIRQNCNGDVVALANTNSAMPIDYKAAFERTAKSLELSDKAMRECQLLLCPQQEWGDCAKDLEDGERCACGFEDGPFANAVPQNREANQLRDRVAELEKALKSYDE